MPLRSPSLARVAQTLVLLSSLSLVASGCGATTGGKTNPPLTIAEGRLKPVDVGDDAFAQSLLKILADGTRSPQRDALLVGVVRRQLIHAQQRFAMGQPARGTDSVLGAFYLVRPGEESAAMVDAAGASAIDGVIRQLSQRGDEGRVHALMQMRAAATDANAPGRADLDEHRNNLERWLDDTQNSNTGDGLEDGIRYLVGRIMFDPDEKLLQTTTEAIDTWFDRAQNQVQNILGQIQRERLMMRMSGIPARAASRVTLRWSNAGTLMLMALYLRNGDAEGALARLEHSAVGRQMDDVLRAALQTAAKRGSAEDWARLAGALASEASPDDSDDELSNDPELNDQLRSLMQRATQRFNLVPSLIDAALLGCLIEAYRKDPTQMSTTSVLARQLVRLGLSEGAPAVLARGLGETPSPRDVMSASQIVFEAMAVDAQSGDNDAVHRTFRAALPLLTIADKPEHHAERLEPWPSRLRLLMATVELRTGDLASARPLYLAAAKANPSVSAWTRVAQTDKQAGDLKAARESLGLAKTAPDARSAGLDLADAIMLGFEIERDAGHAAEAQAALGEALTLTLAARQTGKAAQRARAETLLGRVLYGYGDTKAARRAHERALTLAAQDRELFGATLLKVVAHTLVRRDLAAARAALHQGLDADLDQETRVYAGLWVFLLEKLERAAPDGQSERALSPSGDRDAWVAKLALWANGKLTSDALFSAAQTPSQKVEAEFYTSMLRKASGDATADKRLRAVADSPVLDLVEIGLARDLLTPPFSAQLPAGVSVP